MEWSAFFRFLRLLRGLWVIILNNLDYVKGLQNENACRSYEIDAIDINILRLISHHSSYFISRYLMINNQSWFDSPVHKSTYIRGRTFGSYSDHEVQDNWNKTFLAESPTVNQSGRMLHQHPLSPWANMIGIHPSINLPDIISQPEIQQKVDKDQKLIFSEDEEEDMVTPQKREYNKQDQSFGEIHTTGKKSQAQNPSFSERKSRPKQKGLRRLSQRAFQIVQQMSNATYKQVAGKLVTQLSEEQFNGQNRQQQNIKRRVYDALNVLIALGVLKKEGRKIVCEQDEREFKIDCNKNKVEALRQRLRDKQNKLKQIRTNLAQSKAKQQELLYLITRNSDISGNIPKIQFPFLAFVDSDQTQSQFELKNNILRVKVSQEVKPIGDIDALKYFRFENKTENN